MYVKLRVRIIQVSLSHVIPLPLTSSVILVTFYVLIMFRRESLL